MSFYLTTPIYYVNAEPHLGHAYTSIAADVIARFRRGQGERTFFLTGTDEHGTKIAQAAQEAGVDVQQFVDDNSQRFRDLLPLLSVQEDFFVRTTDPGHVAVVQQMLQRLHESGDVYEDRYSGLYCTPCEAYYTEQELLEGDLCPTHKQPVTQLSERNYFFRLSAYEDRLREWMLANPEWIQPRSRYNEALSFIEAGLRDISITRSSITWGVQVPWDPEQVAYVWIDALFNYYSALSFASDEDQTAQFWPPQVQLLGKDILKFHAVIWPALLMACGLQLPRALFIHGYLMMGGEKMSKTMGNVFDPFPVIEQYGADALRFYVLREVQFGQDGVVSRESFLRRYEGELANDLGNLVSRTVAMVRRYCDATVPAATDGPIAQACSAMVSDWTGHMRASQLTAALESVWEFVRLLNRHVEEQAPWKLAKDPDQRELLDATLAELAEGIVAIGGTLEPFIPTSAAAIAAAFGGQCRPDHEWGRLAGNAVAELAPLFPKRESS